MFGIMGIVLRRYDVLSCFDREGKNAGNFLKYQQITTSLEIIVINVLSALRISSCMRE
jgi:hypothetical protein